MAYYHVTTLEAWNLIKQDNKLIPKIGPRSRQANEQLPLIYAFSSWDELSDSAWVFEEFEDDAILVIIELKECDCFRKSEGFECEVVSSTPIDLSNVLRVLDADTELELN